MIAVVSFGNFLFAAYSPKYIPLSSPFYDQVDALYRIEGLARPSDARPWSNAEAAKILEALPDRTRTRSLREQAASMLETILSPAGSDGLSYRFSGTVSLESYLHVDDEHFVTDDDWVYGVDERQPFLAVDMEAQYGTVFYFGTEVEVGISDTADGDETEEYDNAEIGVIVPDSIEGITKSQLLSSIFSSNIDLNATTFDANWPKHSQIGLGGNWWNVSMARGTVKWGNGQSGNLIIGDQIESNNTLRLDLFAERFKMELLYLFLEDSLDDENQRIFLGRRFEFLPFSWIRATITENIMYSGDSIPLKYLNPTSVYHNYYDADHLNAIASAELSIAPYEGVSVYGQAALDQYQLPTESDSIPDAYGFLVGAGYSWLAGPDGFFDSNAEWAYTSPSLYRRDEVNFLVYRGLENNGSPYLFDYLGYEYGSDTQTVRLDFSYTKPGTYSVGTSVTVLWQGEVDMYYSTGDTDTTYPKVFGLSPSGDEISRTAILDLQGTWWPSSSHSVKLYGEIDFIGRDTYEKSSGTSSDRQFDIQLTTGVSYGF
jgi:hypothetical protein